MAGIKDIPMSKVKEVLSSGKDLADSRNQTVRVAVFIDPTAPSDLVLAIKEAFVPQLPTGHLHVEMLFDDVAVRPNASTDIALVLVGDSDERAEACVRALCAANVAAAVVAESSLDVPDLDGLPSSASVALIAASNSGALLDKLARWIIDTTDKDLAFAANFVFLRRPKAERIISSCAGQNAAVGAIPILPGADMPIMTANQAKMALEIAAVYGRDVSPERIPELLGVVGGGFALRTVAREAVGFVPAVGWALKGGIGYAGTVAMGNALLARFELGDDPEGLHQAVGSVTDRASAVASDFSSKFSDIASSATHTASRVANDVSDQGKKRVYDAYEYVTVKTGRRGGEDTTA